ncbi:hypothetical protein BKA70DRAFT_184069 [Coprinopsis sp. MPI-PUGE-AT-0042]|nr:hypothetical protein BKA70DRAFT_184069 [Coprinopsis sp. MPI-PUGE-AT-0042]
MSTPDDDLKWHLHLTYAATVLALSMAAIQILLWIYMVKLYIEETPETRKRRLPYIMVSLAILVLYSTSAVITGVYTYNLLTGIAPRSSTLEVAPAGELIHGSKPRMTTPVGVLFMDIAIRIADALLLYRCYIIWFDYPWVSALPVGIFIAGLAINIRTYIPFNFNDDILDGVDASLTLGLTILTLTILISFRLLRAQKQLASALPHTDHKIYIGIAALLVESAAPLAACGIGYIVTSLVVGSTAFYANGVFTVLYAFVAIAAPQLIIFRVAIGASWANKTERSAIVSRPIEFAAQAQTRSSVEGRELAIEA